MPVRTQTRTAKPKPAAARGTTKAAPAPGWLDTRSAGVLAITDSWPGQLRTVYGDHERFVQNYLTQY